MDSLCVRVGTVCGLDSGVGQVRHPKDEFNGCDCNPDNRGSGLFMADGVHRRLAGTAFRNQRKTLLFLILSGLATGASWLCYFRALQIGDINKVVPVDKSSTVLTILLAVIFLHESLSIAKGAGIVLIAAGTYLMIEKKQSDGAAKAGSSWLLYAAGSAVFASLTSILGKIGISGVESNLGTAIRTGVVLVMSWMMVFVTGRGKLLRAVPKNELGFICLSGLATGGSWLCYYKALQDGPASVVAPIDKLSILVTILFSWLVFHEKLTKNRLPALLLSSAEHC